MNRLSRQSLMASVMALCLVSGPTLALNTNIALNKCYVAGSTGYFSNPQNAFDGNPATGAGGGSDVNFGGTLAMDFGTAKNLLKMSITYSENNRTAQRYTIQYSTDGTNWIDMLYVSNPQWPTDTRDLPSGQYQYLRYSTGNDQANPWGGETSSSLTGVSEIQVFERGAGDPPGNPINRLPVALDQTGWSYKTINGGAITPPVLLKYQLMAGDGFQVDMGSARQFDQFSYAADHEAIPLYKLYVSDGGSNWGSAIYTRTVNGGDPIASFPLQNKRYFRIVSDITLPNRWWGVSSFSFFNSTGSTPQDTGDNINIALNKSAVNSKGNAGVLFDGNIDNSTAGGQVTVDLGQSYAIGRIIVRYPAISGDGAWYTISTSDDNTSFTTRQFVFRPGSFLQMPIINRIMANYSCRYLRFEFPEHYVGGSGYFPYDYNEIEVYKSNPPVIGPHTNFAPTCAVTSPATGASFGPAPASIVINASAADIDGRITKVEFFNGTTRLGESTTAPYTYTWSNVAVGTYSITAKAYDDSASTPTNATTSAAVSVRVTNNAPPALLARTGWSASASKTYQTQVASNALDGNTGSIWSLGETPGETTNQSFTLDMKSTNLVYSIALQQSSGNYIKNYSVYVTNDTGSLGTAVATGTGTTEDLTITLATPASGRYIRIAQTGGTCSCWWGLAEINVTGVAGTVALVNQSRVASRGITGKGMADMCFYTITGRRINAHNIHGTGAGLYISKNLNTSRATILNRSLNRKN